MTLNEALKGERVYNIQPWPLLGDDYWMAQRYNSDKPTSTKVDPRDWAAPLRDGRPIIHDGMVTYLHVAACWELQREWDEFSKELSEREIWSPDN